MTKHVEPSVSEMAFNCPHCGAYTSHTWYKVQVKHIANNEKPSLPFLVDRVQLDCRILELTDNGKSIPDEDKEIFDWAKKAAAGFPFIHIEEEYGFKLTNAHISECYVCSKLAIWVYDKLVYPNHKCQIEPNQDMNPDIIQDFNEAREIVDISPRGAAALLRLCVQKLCIQLGEKGENINNDIASLVKKGLDVRIQQALDVVRVIGNDSVHPGEMNLNDTPDIAHRLFDIVNMVAKVMITQPKELSDLYDGLPEGRLTAIEKRDVPKPKK